MLLLPAETLAGINGRKNSRDSVHMIIRILEVLTPTPWGGDGIRFSTYAPPPRPGSTTWGGYSGLIFSHSSLNFKFSELLIMFFWEFFHIVS